MMVFGMPLTREYASTSAAPQIGPGNDGNLNQAPAISIARANGMATSLSLFMMASPPRQNTQTSLTSLV